MLSVGYRIPKAGSNVLFSSGPVKSKVELLEAARLLKDKGFLVINQRFSIKKITNKSLIEYPTETIKLIKQNNKYYSDYLTNLNRLLCETDFIGKQNQRLAVYSKVYTGNLSD